VEEDGPRHATPVELKAQIAAERLGVPFLVYRDGDDEQRLFTLGGERVTIGRADDNDVAIAWDARASRLHAELQLTAGQWVVDDDGLSRNGTWVNGRRLVRRQRLRDGDVLRVGSTQLRFRLPLRTESSPTLVDAGLPSEATLSPAQHRVLVALCRPAAGGSPDAMPASNAEIAGELVLSVASVKTHLRALYEKFGVDDLGQNRKRTALAARALQSGAVTPEQLLRG
jgi:pSer/pThr/pTyr-binding forkhead associated (FHA) protein